MSKQIDELNNDLYDEIIKHKWLLSEKLGKDVGYDTATEDWLSKHFPDWTSNQKKLLLDIL